MRKAKIASVGCGWVAKRWHLSTIAELTKRGDLDYIAVCDVDADVAREAGETYGLPYYTDVEEMLDKHSNIDVVDISTGDYEKTGLFSVKNTDPLLIPTANYRQLITLK